MCIQKQSAWVCTIEYIYPHLHRISAMYIYPIIHIYTNYKYILPTCPNV